MAKTFIPAGGGTLFTSLNPQQMADRSTDRIPHAWNLPPTTATISNFGGATTPPPEMSLKLSGEIFSMLKLFPQQITSEEFISIPQTWNPPAETALNRRSLGDKEITSLPVSSPQQETVWLGARSTQLKEEPAVREPTACLKLWEPVML